MTTFTHQPLAGVRVVTIAVYVPALVAAQRLRACGASVTIVAPPGGDPLAEICRPWHDALRVGQERVTVDLKSSAGRESLDVLLRPADVLITALRPAALERLGLGSADLTRRYPALSHVAIVGYPPPRENEPGHDLTYQASVGLLASSALPRTLIADLAGAEQAAQAALAALIGQARGGPASHVMVALSDAVDDFADPLRYGMTTSGGVLGGALPQYHIYEAADGWIAVAALERHFMAGLLEALGIEGGSTDERSLAERFRARSAIDWERWAAERDLPIIAVRDRPSPRQSN